MITVSLIEDDKHYRWGLEKLINNSAEFQVLFSYESAEAAIPHIFNNPPAIAIIDIKLPGKSGIDLIYDITHRNPDIQCMVCSYYDNNDYVFNALKNGAHGYILKDSMPHEILNSLKEISEGGAPMSKYIAKKVISTFQNKQPVQKLEELTDRENEVLQLVATGLIVKEISDKLTVSSHTIKSHLRKIYTKLHVNNRVEAVNKLNIPRK